MTRQRVYYERGQAVEVLTWWGRGGGPHNVRVCRADGTVVIRPFRGLRRQPNPSGTHIRGWRGWVARAIATAETLLQDERDRLHAMRAGRRLKSHNMGLGWTEADRLASQEALVSELEKWTAYLRDPDQWLQAFLERDDFGSPAWTAGWDDRETRFYRKHAAEPAWEKTRPYHAARRRKAAARYERTGPQPTPATRTAVYERDAGICWICRQPVERDDFHLDHVDPYGGSAPDNLRLAHPLCNVQRSSPDGRPPGSYRYQEDQP